MKTDSANDLKLNDEELHSTLLQKVQLERDLTIEVIHLLRLVERRRAFRGYSSLFEYCVKELNYSESAAMRRISAMRLLKELPETETAIKDGKLTLSNVSAAQTFFRTEQKIGRRAFSSEEKTKILKNLEHRSTREAQKSLLALAIATSPTIDRQKIVSSSHSELTVTIDDETVEMLRKLKEIHSHRNVGTAEILKDGLRALLASLETKSKTAKHSRAQNALPAPVKPCVNRQPTEQISSCRQLLEQRNTCNLPPEKGAGDLTTDKRTSRDVPPNRTRYIPTEIRRQVFKRDNGTCTHVDKVTKRKCGSRWKIQIDHIRPIAIGGNSEIKNLRLLCQNHNLSEAQRTFGREFMSLFLEK